MDYDRIIGLLDKYWKCETTLPEEEELRYFYKHCRQMPEELAEYREMFIFQEGESRSPAGFEFCIFEDEQRTTTVGREYGRNEMDKPIYKINR